MTKPTSQRIGRPPISPDEILIARSIRMKASQWAKVEQYGAAWVRDLIDRAKPPPGVARPAKAPDPQADRVRAVVAECEAAIAQAGTVMRAAKRALG